MKQLRYILALALLVAPAALAQVAGQSAPTVSFPVESVSVPAKPAAPSCPVGFNCTPIPAAAPTVIQGAVSAAESAVKTLTAPPPACPSSFYAAGATYDSGATTSKFAGFYAIATPITKCGATFQAYSITMNVLTPAGSGKNLSFTDTTTTGAAIPIKQLGSINIYAFGNVGVAATSTATKLGSNWGGFATIPLPFWSMKFIPIGQNVNGKWTYGAAIGRSW